MWGLIWFTISPKRMVQTLEIFRAKKAIFSIITDIAPIGSNFAYYSVLKKRVWKTSHLEATFGDSPQKECSMSKPPTSG